MKIVLVIGLLLAAVSSLPTSKLLRNGKESDIVNKIKSKDNRLKPFHNFVSPFRNVRQLLSDSNDTSSSSSSESDSNDTSSSSDSSSMDNSTSSDSSSIEGTGESSSSSSVDNSTSSDSSSSSSSGSSSGSSSNDTSSDSGSESGSDSDSTDSGSDSSTSSDDSMNNSTSSSSSSSSSCDNSQIELDEGWSILETSISGTYTHDSESSSFIRDDEDGGVYSVWFNTIGQLTIGDATSGFAFISYTTVYTDWTDDNNPAINSDDETNWEAGDEIVTFETGTFSSYCDGNDLGDALCSDDGISLIPDLYECQETENGGFEPSDSSSSSSSRINSWNVTGLMALIAILMKML